jgi:endonuclease/exonuclease/phosphatase family metal-dependent hydrolase
MTHHFSVRFRRAAAVATLAAALIVPALSAVPASAAISPLDIVTTATSLNVATFNVRCANCSKKPANSREKRWEVRREVIVDQILSQHVDVIGVQEASPGLLDDRTTSQFEDLLARLGSDYTVTDASRYNCTRTDTTFTRCGGYKDQGASQDSRIFFKSGRLSLQDSGSLRLDGRGIGNGSARYMAWAKFTDRVTGKKFIFATAHFEPGVSKSKSATRVKQVKKAVAELNRVNTADLPIIWGSDLASSKLTHVGNKSYNAFIAAGFTDPLDNFYKAKKAGPDAYADRMVNEQYFTLNNFAAAPKNYVSRGYKLGAHLDYILIKSKKQANVTEWAQVLNLNSSGDYAGVIPSDHNMVRATVVIP